MPARKPDPPLRAGYEAEWAALKREEAELRARSMALTPYQRLQVGQKLSQRMVALQAASVRAGHASIGNVWPDGPPNLKRLMARSRRAEQMRVLLKDVEPHGGNAAETVKASRLGR